MVPVMSYKMQITSMLNPSLGLSIGEGGLRKTGEDSRTPGHLTLPFAFLLLMTILFFFFF